MTGGRQSGIRHGHVKKASIGGLLALALVGVACSRNPPASEAVADKIFEKPEPKLK